MECDQQFLGQAKLPELSWEVQALRGLLSGIVYLRVLRHCGSQNPESAHNRGCAVEDVNLGLRQEAFPEVHYVSTVLTGFIQLKVVLTRLVI